MDRQARKGTLGLSIAWLQSGAAHSCKQDHLGDKLKLSLERSFEDRRAARDSFIGASSTNTEFACILDLEKRVRDGACDEPLAIYCKANIEDLVAAMDDEAAAP